MGVKDNMNKRLSIVIPVFNKYNFTKACLNDLSKLPDDHEIIVVDNGSSDETQAELKNNTRIHYVRSEVNEGFAKACNKGYAEATSSNVLFLNNDIRVKSDYDNWTEQIIYECDHEDCLIGPTMGQLDKDLNFIQEANKNLIGNSYMSGWCLAASKKVFDKLVLSSNQYKGPFSEEFGIAYFEDTDLSFRTKRKNIAAFQLVDIPVVHFGKVSSKQLNTSKLYSEARKIFVEKWKK